GFATLPSVIICADLFLAPAKDLASHRTKNKIPTIVVREKLIERCIPGVDAPDKIRNYIKILHRNFRTNWILLFGDVGTRSCGTFIDVPTRMAVDPVPYSGVDDGWIPCDYYYACLDGTWDGNNNRRYGEAADKPDLLPEVWVGRIPANDLDVAQSIVSAIIAYETKVPAAKGFLLAANDLGWGCHELTFKEKTYLPLAQACGTPSIKRLYQKWNNLSASTLAAAVNGGVDFIEYYGHGSPTSTQVMSAAQVGTLLKRTPSYPAVFALSCSTSRYDANECFGEAWVEGLKASAYIGSARVAYGSQSGGEGLDVRFIQAYRFSRSCGLSLAVAKAQLFTSFGYGADTLKTILEFTLLGDPVMLHRVK
ncbi:MAG: hypothetical protein JXP34_28285, partial [Planctomycetes bacterium]|nr:hypothetical protein [Planctomycetota bacterium]